MTAAAPVSLHVMGSISFTFAEELALWERFGLPL